MNNNLRNLIYWLKRFVLDTILRRYHNIDIDIPNKLYKEIVAYCIENELTMNQYFELALKKHIKNKKMGIKC
jgi:hypothetical protein